ncbi:type-F conjugative transfer system mating-pair stabilization protein TraN [Legionella anisa]|uniref:Type-F conjugative transfer system mating-pair stabilization protein TraN n=2 Tax=Legionella anisa TaxID=28082 RepID=A0AAX0X069_9GAMM|nr:MULTISPECIES: type-F conjugative transfer system mating-pair stabilization protein TraN [Legionella]HAT9164309.1 type-F conjugative transfer system mating-pair stabilization protein TraN [Legionella pneumophila subsp. pneumophila]AWN76023.1 type-F conjugative transfer system mating-pair stabilization protein TraN [Legionella anisa]MCW8426890.1 type-F conjugative transfer system mating-pair stabilization protein TraN [Legionella anisa]MCW8449569.1 type-F conjugative transfer system mating-pai
MRQFGCILIGFLFTTFVSAQNQNDALHARDEALRALNGFNPATVLKGYTANPGESALQPQEGSNALGAAGLNVLKNNEAAREVYSQAGSRAKVQSNPNSPEMQYAERLLENPDGVLDGACYKQAGVCKNESVIKTCDESVHYTTSSCKDTLNVLVKPITQSFSRVVTPNRFQSTATFDLQACPPRDWRCTTANTALIAPNCEYFAVSVSRYNQAMLVTKQPTCTDPTVTVQFSRRGGYSAPLQVTVTEYVSEDQWKTSECERIITEHAKSFCIMDSSQSCLEPNQAKVIGGISVKRSCWGRGYNYQCAAVFDSACTPLINQGCSQTGSTCVQAKANRCERYSQTFSCIQQFCMPEKTVCPGKVGCSDGQCDTSQNEESDDMAEGLSRFGALAGVAGEVSANQIRSGAAVIFTGKNSTCRKVKGNVRNCCRGSYQMTHCSGDEKLLAYAREEGRAFKVGKFCALKKLGICLEEKQSWCVFPTKLAAIIQIQGRNKQLGINFGWAKDEDNRANCRGITPEELERINFAALDLSPIQQELIARMAVPNNGSINNANQSHIERLKQQGRAHD